MSLRSVTPKPDGLRAPGGKTPQEFKDSSKLGHKTKDFIVVWTPFRRDYLCFKRHKYPT